MLKRLNVGLLPGCLVVVVFKDHTAAAAQCRHTDFLAISLAANRGRVSNTDDPEELVSGAPKGKPKGRRGQG